VDLLTRGMDWLADRRERTMSVAIWYYRPTLLAGVLLTATSGQTTFTQSDGMGVVHRVESRDWLLPAESLVIATETITPQVGDLVYEYRGDRVFVHEVLPLAGGPAWEWHDRHRRSIRVHTKYLREHT
jgi:hypothetical protein